MSYRHFKDLDEYSEKVLRAELQRRYLERLGGKCDYCGRWPSTIPCRFKLRHHDRFSILQEKRLSEPNEIRNRKRRTRAEEKKLEKK